MSSEYLLTLAIHAVPGAKRTQAAGTHADALRVRISAPPVDGKANQALTAWLAETFDVPKRNVTLLTGTSARQKRFALHFADADALAAAQTRLAELRGEN